MTTRTVSQILLEDFGIAIQIGRKGECPQCHNSNFSLKPDDTLGKCFSPSCGYFLTMGRDNGQYPAGLTQVLTSLYTDCHAELLQLASGQHNAYTYLRDERGIHSQVIADAMLGAVPSSYDVTPHLQPVLDDAKATVDALKSQQRGRPTKQVMQAEKRLHDLQEAHQKLVTCLAHKAGWLMFVYTDAYHHPVALRLRNPYTKTFASFKPGIAGLFGRDLFTPYRNPAYQAMNEFLLVTEGEFNLLQLQSLTVRYAEAIAQPSEHCYHHVCAVGGVTVADIDTIKRVAAHPVICFDHDTSQAGFELVKRCQQVMPVEACTTPLTWGSKSDLDSYIRDFDHDHKAAWEGVKALIADRQAYGRTYSGTGKEFFEYPYQGKQEVFTPKLLGDALLERQTYRYTASQLWVYRDGVYVPEGAALLREDAQWLLGIERRTARIDEALSYVEVASQIDADTLPDPEYVNVLNGRFHWSTQELHPHTSAVFTTVQLPVVYDPDALCPVFDNYLKTTFAPDVIPVIEEILGWCLIPDRRFEQGVMLHGEGANGKSVFLDLIGDLLGTANVSNVALQDLEENRFRSAELYGKLANIFADLDARGLRSSSMFKTLTTGDYITAERKHAQPFRFRSFAKLLFSANKIPSSRDKTHAFYRRWVIIPFTQTFNGVDGNPEPDRGLRAKLKTELPGILNRALQGLNRLMTQDAFSPSTTIDNAKKAYIKDNDHMQVFLEECVVRDLHSMIVKKDFRALYGEWCERQGLHRLSDFAIKEALKEFQPRLGECREDSKNKYSPMCWLGIGWTTDAADYKPQTITTSKGTA